MPLPRRHRPTVPVWALLLIFSADGRAAEVPAPTYKAGTSEVRISFRATDDHGDPQTALKKDDFAIVDGGRVIRTFSSLNKADEDFLDIVILLDVSESVAEDFRQMANAALQLVSAKELAFNTSISLMTFSGTHSKLLCNGDCRGSDLNFLSVTPSGATPLLDAISDTSLFLSAHHRPGTKPVIVLFSDGIDTCSISSIQDAMRNLIDTQIALYAVDAGEPTKRMDGSSILRLMAETSGGGYFAMGEDTSAALLRAFDELRHSYVVTYKLEHAPGGYHSLRILPTRNLSLQFHSRSGYYYEADQ
jgi:VWFA-related protein